MKKLTIVILLLLLVACTPKEEPNLQATIDASINQTMTAVKESEPEPTNTPIPTNTTIPTSTKVPTKTPRPTSTPTIKPTIDASLVLAKNYVTSYEENGVIFEVVRVLIADKNWTSLKADFPDPGVMADKKTYIEYVFRITNNTDKIISVSYYSIIASANGEQSEFGDFYDHRLAGDDLSNDILPGSVVIGGNWTGINRSAWNEVNKILISIPRVYDSNYDKVTNDFLITIDVVDWSFEPIPDEF